MKTKEASISLHKGIIRINKNILPYISPESIKYLLVHELIHYKLKSKYHSKKFFLYIDKLLNSNIEKLEDEIIKALFITSGILSTNDRRTID